MQSAMDVRIIVPFHTLRPSAIENRADSVKVLSVSHIMLIELDSDSHMQFQIVHSPVEQIMHSHAFICARIHSQVSGLSQSLLAGPSPS